MEPAEHPVGTRGLKSGFRARARRKVDAFWQGGGRTGGVPRTTAPPGAAPRSTARVTYGGFLRGTPERQQASRAGPQRRAGEGALPDGRVVPLVDPSSRDRGPPRPLLQTIGPATSGLPPRAAKTRARPACSCSGPGTTASRSSGTEAAGFTGARPTRAFPASKDAGGDKRRSTPPRLRGRLRGPRSGRGGSGAVYTGLHGCAFVARPGTDTNVEVVNPKPGLSRGPKAAFSAKKSS